FGERLERAEDHPEQRKREDGRGPEQGRVGEPASSLASVHGVASACASVALALCLERDAGDGRRPAARPRARARSRAACAWRFTFRSNSSGGGALSLYNVVVAAAR